MNKIEFDKIVSFTALLERCHEQVQKNDRANIQVPDTDRPLYDAFFQELVLTDLLPDGKGMGESTNDTNVGMGRDALGSRAEYFQLLMQCYRYLYLALSSGEVFLQPTGWTTACRSDALSADAVGRE